MNINLLHAGYVWLKLPPGFPRALYLLRKGLAYLDHPLKDDKKYLVAGLCRLNSQGYVTGDLVIKTLMREEHISNEALPDKYVGANAWDMAESAPTA